MIHARGRLAGLGVAVVALLGGLQWNAVQNASAGGPERPTERAVGATRPRATIRSTTTVAPRGAVPVTSPGPSVPPATAAPATTEAPVTTVGPPPVPTTGQPTTTTAAPAPAPAPAPRAAPAPAPAAGGYLSTRTQAEMLARVNARRATGTTCGDVAYPPVPALSLQGNLRVAADAHALDMAANDYFSHTGLDGSDPGDRVSAAGYRWSAWAENIAAGQGTATIAVDGWFSSPGHCVNFMSATPTQIGFGAAENPTSRYRIYWVAELGRPA